MTERPWSVDDVPLSIERLTDEEARHVRRFALFLAEKEASSPGLAVWWSGLADALGATLTNRFWQWDAVCRDPSGVPVSWAEAVASLPLLPPDDGPLAYPDR